MTKSLTKKISPYAKWDELAAKAQTGDKKAYRKLLEDITPFIRKSLIGTLANADWVDDITQNILISVHKSLATYSPGRPFKPWLSAIINFRQKDYLRKHYSRRKDKHIPFEEEVLDKEYVTNPTHAGEYKDIKEALAALPDKQREIFELIKIQGFTAKEVAKKLDMNASAVKVSAHRTMTKLKSELG
jgi:RNA polymerase sigma-70 factor (ECF subfamily)